MDQMTFSEAEYQNKKRKTRREIFLERHGLGKALFKEVNKHLEKNGLILREGGIVDAAIIAAPSSTKNSTGKRDPQMHQTRKGNQWYFGMKMHIGVDDKLELIHSVETTPANVRDIAVKGKLLHGRERRVFGGAGYLGVMKRADHRHRKNTEWFIARRSDQRCTLDALQLEAEKAKASVRAKVEHPSRYIKQMFGYNNVRDRGLAKNNSRLHLLAAFSNPMMSEKHLLA